MRLMRWLLPIAGVCLLVAVAAINHWQDIGEFLLRTGVLRISFENQVQKRRSAQLEAALVSLKDTGKVKLSLNFASLPTYPNVCRNAIPPIPQKDCLQLVIDGPTLSVADQQAVELVQIIHSQLSKDIVSQLRGVYVVIWPAVRSETYFGQITPYAVGKNFKFDKPLITTIGD